MINDELLFADPAPGEDRDTASTTEPRLRRWRILIVDDEEEVHKVTALVLKNVRFDGSPIELLHADSGLQARQILQQEANIALALVDVVMETDDAGLVLCRWIREELENRQIRLVLRTGQAGQAPEHSVIVDYDINDYKEKTELTQTKLRTLVYAALRSYRDIMTIDRSREGLERVINAISRIYESKSLKTFATAVLEQIETLLDIEHDSLHARPITALQASHEQGSTEYEVIAATGEIAEQLRRNPQARLPQEILDGFERALRERASFQTEDCYFGYFTSSLGGEHLMYVNPAKHIGRLERHLLDIYAANVGIAFDNVKLGEEISETQRELVYILGDAVEWRSRETGMHVQRVAKISELLAREYGLPQEQVELIKLAAPLHDLGKIAIPDAILNKPGKHDPAEWEIMQTHARLGFDLLNKSHRRILQKAAVIALHHHENWDGSGYPAGLKGEQIDISGRIVALADVFDALGSKRCYKEAWPLERIRETIVALSGSKFDPALVALFEQHFAAICRFRELHPDAAS
jgi:response regulator RpfG family c-di-GMP phosphodiesterase